jgi:hypothetical protein
MGEFMNYDLKFEIYNSREERNTLTPALPLRGREPD